MGTVSGSTGLTAQNAVDYTNNVTVINDTNLNDIQKQILLNKAELEGVNTLLGTGVIT